MVERGWTLRNVINWRKPNQMPQSATDRFTVDFEPIFFFTQSKEYYFEQQFEEYTEPLDRWGGCYTDGNVPGSKFYKTEKQSDQEQLTKRARNFRPNDKGRNMRTTWDINTEPYKDAHFAVYPEKLVERMIKAGCPENGLVLDPFMGAGTTGLVAKKINRHYLGFELNPEYKEMAENRIKNEIGLFL
jgi:site-specific DNA-methyltransferase (adenine-specific)